MISRVRRPRRPLLAGACALALTALLAGLLLAPQGALTGMATAIGLATPPAAGPSWQLKLAIHYLPPQTNRSQYLVALAEPGGTWLLGGSDLGGASLPEAELVRNGIPRSVPLPAGPRSWIAAASASGPGDVWAVTRFGGSVLRWDGSAWAVAPGGGWAKDVRFTGIVVTDAQDVWVFGTSALTQPGAGTWHFTGSAWTRVRGAASYIARASEAGPGDLWGIGGARAAGDPDRALLHYTGVRWVKATPPALAGFAYTAVLALSPVDVWVAGSVAGRPELGHYDGSGWTAYRMPGTVPATGFCRDGAGGLWVIAGSGTAPSQLRHRSARGTWTRAVVSRNPANQVLSCALVSGTTHAWGAGKSTAPGGSAAAGYRYG